MLCGAGLEATKAYLTAQNSDSAAAALAYLRSWEEAGDFDGFSVEARADWYSQYSYGSPASSGDDA